MYNKFHFVQKVGNLDLDLFFTQEVKNKKEAATIVKDLLDNSQVTTADYSVIKGAFDNDVKSALDFIDDRVQEGWKITYDIMNQVTNGYLKPDGTPKNGDWDMPMFTYTVYAVSPSQNPALIDNSFDDPYEGLYASFNNLVDMYIWLANEMEKYNDKGNV